MDADECLFRALTRNAEIYTAKEKRLREIVCKPEPRKIIRVEAFDGGGRPSLVLCNDGTMWSYDHWTDTEWKRVNVPEIPQGD